MRRILWGLVLALSAMAWAMNGDMGVGTEPQTDGSAEYPWLIEDLADFNAFAGSSTYWTTGVHTKLMTDINLSGKKYGRAVIAPDTDDQVYHFQGTPFVGAFDGNYHTIRNFRITGKDLLGLFGHLGETFWDGNGGSIANLNVTDVQITGSGNWIGGLVGGHRNGTITNCYTSGSIIGTGQDIGIGHEIGGLVGYLSKGEIVNCRSSAHVAGQYYVGGLVGISRTGNIIQYSSFSGDVNGDTVGGLVGHNSSTLVGCFNDGQVNGGSYIGGLVGNNEQGAHVIQYSWNTGRVSGESSIGGLVGYNSFADILNCYSTGEVVSTSTNSAGGLVGTNRGRIISCLWDVESSGTNDGVANESPDPPGAVGKTTLEMQVRSTFTDAGWDFVNETANGTHQIWQMPAGGSYPVLSRLNGYIPIVLSGNGTLASPYLIGNALELGAIYDYDSNATYKLANEIDLAGIQWSTAVIPLLEGKFDGAGYTICNLNIEGGSNLGLFGRLGSDAVVVDLQLNTIDVHGMGDDVGGLVGDNGGNLINCSANGYVNGGGFRVGGLVGTNYGEIENSHWSGCVNGNREYVGGVTGANRGSVMVCYSDGSIIGNEIVGGLIGHNAGVLTNCYSMGNVAGITHIGGLVGENASNIQNCYSTGKVNGTEAFGGLVGVHSYGTILQSFWSFETSGTTIAYTIQGGSYPDYIYNPVYNMPEVAEGKTTVEMMSLSTFNSWDFTTPVWRMLRPGEDYPRLAWQAVYPGDMAGLYGVDMYGGCGVSGEVLGAGRLRQRYRLRAGGY